MCFLDEAVQQILLQRLAGHRSAPPERCMNVVGHVLDLDTWHVSMLAPFWRHGIYPGAIERKRKGSGAWLTAGVSGRPADRAVLVVRASEMVVGPCRDRRRLAGAVTTYIELGLPWENLVVESFNGRGRDELLNVRSRPSSRPTLLSRPIAWSSTPTGPHSSFGRQTPAEYARSWTTSRPASDPVTAGPDNDSPPHVHSQRESRRDRSRP